MELAAAKVVLLRMGGESCREERGSVVNEESRGEGIVE